MSPTERARVQRLNRRLREDNQKITVSRSRKPARYVIYDLHSNNVDAWSDELETWEREEGLAT